MIRISHDLHLCEIRDLPRVRYNDQLVLSSWLPSNLPFLQPAANSDGVW